MSIEVNSLRPYTPPKGVFFFDANIWFHIVAPGFDDLKRYEEDYVAFFEKVLKEETGIIAVSNLLISEVINVYLKKVAFTIYRRDNDPEIKPWQYKTIYRKTDHYKSHYAMVLDEIESRSDSFKYLGDNLDASLLTQAGNYLKMDYNDYSYYKLLEEHPETTIVTHDGDFLVENIKVLTKNRTLIDSATLAQRRADSSN